jgi:hypothetical protein
LQLEPGCTVRSHPELGLNAIKSGGAYLISYDGALSVRESTPPQLYLDRESITLQPAEPQELEPVHISARIHNAGLEDAHEVPVAFHFRGASGHYETSTTTVALVPGEGNQVVTTSWVPSASGQWQVHTEIDSAGNFAWEQREQGASPLTVEVAPLADLSWQELLSLPGEAGDISILVLILFFSIVAVAACTFLVYVRSLPVGNAKDGLIRSKRAPGGLPNPRSWPGSLDPGRAEPDRRLRRQGEVKKR